MIADRKKEIEKLDKLIRESLAAKKALEAEDKKDAIDQIKSLMAQSKITLEDLGAMPMRSTGSSSSGRKKSESIPMYRNQSTGATWTGRGRRPGWMPESKDDWPPLLIEQRVQ